eukprot:876748-Rhodomonas_salina.2
MEHVHREKGIETWPLSSFCLGILPSATACTTTTQNTTDATRMTVTSLSQKRSEDGGSAGETCALGSTSGDCMLLDSSCFQDWVGMAASRRVHCTMSKQVSCLVDGDSEQAVGTSPS